MTSSLVPSSSSGGGSGLSRGNGGRRAGNRRLLYALLLASLAFLLTINIVHHVLLMESETLSTAALGKSLMQDFQQLSRPREESNDSNSGENERNDEEANGSAEGTEDDGGNGSDDTESTDNSDRHQLAGLSCERYGGPSDKAAEEVVYWSDIPSDSKYRSPFYDANKYLTFEPDQGGWNNIRMAMETVLVLAHAMGRTLVLPPEARMYLLVKDAHKQKTEFSFNDFFHLDSLDLEHEGINITTMEEFLTKMAVTGKLKDKKTGTVLKPPEDRVNWDGIKPYKLFEYLRTVGLVRPWDSKKCVAAFPSTADPKDIQNLHDVMEEIKNDPRGMPKPIDYKGKPVGVKAPLIDRLRENLADRDELCIYDEEMQNADLIHITMDRAAGTRLLIHFYSFVFFEDWRHDLWTKRFIRDHVRYVDEVMCAAARVIEAVRQKARENDPEGDPDGLYDAFHIRRGDFQYKVTRADADVIYDISKNELQEGATVYIATDERNKDFFKPMAEHYKLLFLDDFKHLFEGLNTNFYGMLDQMICTRSRVFYGTWFSTFSGYINRMRGYYTVKHKLEGYKDGTLNSWYFPIAEKWDEMRIYWPTRKPFYMREFPTGWVDIDEGIDELWDVEREKGDAAETE